MTHQTRQFVYLSAQVNLRREEVWEERRIGGKRGNKEEILSDDISRERDYTLNTFRKEKEYGLTLKQSKR